MGGMEVERERDKGARGQVRQQESRGASHYDSSSFFMPRGFDHNLKASGRTKRPRETVDDSCESGYKHRARRGGGGGEMSPRTRTRQQEIEGLKMKRIWISQLKGFFACDLSHLSCIHLNQEQSV